MLEETEEEGDDIENSINSGINNNINRCANPLLEGKDFTMEILSPLFINYYPR